ncbi:MAG: chorismate synthase, partial [Gemmatimonadota bacterium]|nr:chorismate synthase [Gemmatimonadota bacterium]
VGVRIGSHVVALGGILAAPPDTLPDDLNAASDPSPVRCLDAEAEGRMIEAIDAARRAGDTLGGVVEVIASGVPVGLGSHVSWDRKLDGRLAGALMSIPAIKAVEIGSGAEAAMLPGSRVHDEIVRDAAQRRGGGYARTTNRAGGLEGGITSGSPLVLRAAMKPISTLMRPLRTVDLRTGETGEAVRERSDVCAVPAAGVVAEAMVALVLTEALLEKCGGDSMRELLRNFDGYLEQIGGGGERG